MHHPTQQMNVRSRRADSGETSPRPPRSRGRRCLDVEWIGEVCHARLHGSSLDPNWTEELADELIDLIEKDGCRKLVISFGEVRCLYSVLLGKLVGVRRAMLARGGRLKLDDVPPFAREVFQVCRLDRHFEFVDNPSQALSEW